MLDAQGADGKAKADGKADGKADYTEGKVDGNNADGTPTERSSPQGRRHADELMVDFDGQRGGAIDAVGEEATRMARAQREEGEGEGRETQAAVPCVF